MTVIAAIKYLWDHYEEIDPYHAQAPLMRNLITEPPETVLRYLMAPQAEGTSNPYSTKEWVEQVEEENDPAEAAYMILEWVEARRDEAQEDAAMQQYLDEGPDRATLNTSKTSPT